LRDTYGWDTKTALESIILSFKLLKSPRSHVT
jgi:hypothetical protein